MKKIAVLFTITVLSLFPLFADSRNIVYNQSFEVFEVDTVEISLVYEELKISRIYGDEISVEIGSNNIKKIPQVSCQNGVFKIENIDKKAKRGTRCTVYLYLPQDLDAMSITINNVSGNIQADILRAQNTVAIGNVSGRTDIGACATELYNVTTVSGNATLQKVTAEYFDFSSTSGNIFAELEAVPLASSGITNISGKSQLYVPKGADLKLTTFSVSGGISNSVAASVNPAAPQITITSVSGKIEIREY